MNDQEIFESFLSKHSVANFKAFKQLEGIDIAPINLIYGQNSGGKSTFIQSILAVSQSLKSITGGKIKFSGNKVNAGTYKTITHKPTKKDSQIIFECSSRSSVKKKEFLNYIDAFDPIRKAKIKYIISESENPSEGELKSIKIVFDEYLSEYELDFELLPRRSRESEAVFFLKKNSYKKLADLIRVVHQKIINSFEEIISLSSNYRDKKILFDIGLRDQSIKYEGNENDIFFRQILNMLRYAAMKKGCWVNIEKGNYSLLNLEKYLPKSKNKYIFLIKSFSEQLIEDYLDKLSKNKITLNCKLNNKEDEEIIDDTEDNDIPGQSKKISFDDLEINFNLSAREHNQFCFLRHDFLFNILDKEVKSRKDKFYEPFKKVISEISKLPNFENEIHKIEYNFLKDLEPRITNKLEASLKYAKINTKRLIEIKKKSKIIKENVFKIFNDLKFDLNYEHRGDIDSLLRLLDEPERIISETIEEFKEVKDIKSEKSMNFDLYLRLFEISTHLNIFSNTISAIKIQIEKLLYFCFISKIFRTQNDLSTEYLLKNIYQFIFGFNKRFLGYFYYRNSKENQVFNENIFEKYNPSSNYKKRIIDSYQGNYRVEFLFFSNESYFDELKYLPFPLFVKLAFPKEFSQQVIHLGPARPGAKRFYTASDIENLSPSDVAYFLKAVGNDVKQIEYETKLNFICKKINFLDNIRITPVKDPGLDAKKIEVKTSGSKTFVNIADTGYGLSQLLPIILNAISDSEKTILIQQPETHLHPRLQAEVGTLMANSVISKSDKKCWIVETHSEIILLRLLKLIRNKKLSSDLLRVYYIDKSSKGGSVIQRMYISEEGEMQTHWPDGFFSNDIDEIFD